MDKILAFNTPTTYVPEENAAQQSGSQSPHEKESAFEKDLAGVINKHYRENGSNTPGHILAAYLADCLQNFDRITSWRQKWYSPEGAPASELIHGPQARGL